MQWQKFRKWSKWACTLGVGAAVALAVVSRFCWCQYYVAVASKSGDTEWFVRAGSGLMFVTRFDGILIKRSPPFATWTAGVSPDWYWGSSGEAIPAWSMVPWHGGIQCGRYYNVSSVGVSVLYPVALTIIGGAVLWYADRRRSGPRDCKECGYDRLGLAAEVECPECGTVLSK